MHLQYTNTPDRMEVITAINTVDNTNVAPPLAAAATGTQIKLECGGVICRVEITEPTLACLRRLVRAHMKIRPRDCRLVWVDNEGDAVTMTEDAHVAEALACATASGAPHRMPRVGVISLVKSTEGGAAPAEAPADPGGAETATDGSPAEQPAPTGAAAEGDAGVSTGPRIFGRRHHAGGGGHRHGCHGPGSLRGRHPHPWRGQCIGAATTSACGDGLNEKPASPSPAELPVPTAAEEGSAGPGIGAPSLKGAAGAPVPPLARLHRAGLIPGGGHCGGWHGQHLRHGHGRSRGHVNCGGGGGGGEVHKRHKSRSRSRSLGGPGASMGGCSAADGNPLAGLWRCLWRKHVLAVAASMAASGSIMPGHFDSPGAVAAAVSQCHGAFPWGRRRNWHRYSAIRGAEAEAAPCHGHPQAAGATVSTA